MSLVETSNTATHKTERKPRRKPKARPIVGDFAWGAAAIGAAIGLDEKQTFHLIYDGALGDAVRKVKGRYVGYVPKLRRLMGGE